MSRNALKKVCIALIVVSLGLSACSKKPVSSNLSDSEKIRQSAQAVLDAKKSSASETEREKGRDAVRKLQEGIDQYQASLLAVLAPSAQVVSPGQAASKGAALFRKERGTKSADAALDQLIGQINEVSSLYGSQSNAPKAGSPEWQMQFTSAGISRLAALKTELEGWRGKPVLEQLELASRFKERINTRQASRSRAGEAPTISAETAHR